MEPVLEARCQEPQPGALSVMASWRSRPEHAPTIQGRTQPSPRLLAFVFGFGVGF